MHHTLQATVLPHLYVHIIRAHPSNLVPTVIVSRGVGVGKIRSHSNSQVYSTRSCEIRANRERASGMHGVHANRFTVMGSCIERNSGSKRSRH